MANPVIKALLPLLLLVALGLNRGDQSVGNVKPLRVVEDTG